MKFPKNLGGLGDMMRQAQQAMDQAKKIEEELALEEITTEKGPVKAVFTGKGEIKSLKINKDEVDLDDIEILEDLIVSAVREGLEKANAMRASRLQKVMPGLPGMPGF